MRILRVIGSMNPKIGGPSYGIRNSIPTLSELGIKNEIVSLDFPNEEFLKNETCTIHALGPTKTSWCYSEKLLPWLYDNLGNFDAVIIHGLWLYHGFAVHKAMKFLKKKGFPTPKVFVMPHGMLDPYFQLAQGRKWKSIRNRIYWALIEKHIINNADNILFTCERELLLAKETFSSYKPKHETNIGYGILAPPPHTSIKQETLNFRFPSLTNQSFILFLSRIHKKKGTDILIQGYLHLKNKGLNLPKLVIAGQGLESKFGQSILDLAGNDPDIIFTGMLNGADKWLALYACEAFILPSHQENFGIAVVEALACSKPVLISDQINIFHEIAECGCGLVASNTLDGVKNLLSQWTAMSKEEKERMNIRAEKCYQRFFTTFEASKKLVSLL
ncbi:MAG: glycosyltransferase [Bacteroidetes bacterium]|nr:glycosyltransferase [Bacteroidota bacterium]